MTCLYRDIYTEKKLSKESALCILCSFCLASRQVCVKCHSIHLSIFYNLLYICVHIYKCGTLVSMHASILISTGALTI